MAEVPLFVVDASAALKWHFQTEAGGQEATDLLTDYVRGQVALIDPPHLPYEVASGIRSRILDKEITPTHARQTLRDFLSLRIPTVEHPGMTGVGFDFSLRYTLSVYDALYVAPAQIEQAHFITGDERLLHALGKRFPLALWIEDYPR